jgi:TPR repeat protein
MIRPQQGRFGLLAEQGYPNSQYYLGMLNANGVGGVPKDAVELTNGLYSVSRARENLVNAKLLLNGF